MSLLTGGMVLARCEGGSVVTKLLATWFVVFSTIGVDAPVVVVDVIVAGAFVDGSVAVTPGNVVGLLVVVVVVTVKVVVAEGGEEDAATVVIAVGL